MTSENEFKVEQLKRKETISAVSSFVVYQYENMLTSNYLKWFPSSYEQSNKMALEYAQKEIDKKIVDATVYDARYSKELGVAVIAIHDNRTNEVIVAFAGTNIKADGLKDLRSDAARGMSDPEQLLSA